MEERVLPPPPPPPPPHSPKLQFPDINSGTYVVQVPKDQIYRVPPPQNARIAELHRNTPKKDTNRRSRCCWCWVLFIVLFIAIVFIVGAILGGLFSVILKPKDPKFSIQRFYLQSKPHKQYGITLQAHNPNSIVGISYKEGGSVSLSLQKQKNNNNIGSGSYPTFYQPHDNSTLFDVTLKSAKPDFPKAVRESMVKGKSKTRVVFSLEIHIEAQMKMLLVRSGTMKYDVACQVTVVGLDKTTRVVSQECETKRY